MAEVLVRYTATVLGTDGTAWVPQACGGVASDGLWEGWIEFISDQRAVRTGPFLQRPSDRRTRRGCRGALNTHRTEENTTCC